MLCAKCGANVNDGDNFCEECGASIKQAPQSREDGLLAFPKSKALAYDNNLAAVTNIGRRHQKNEDAGIVLKLQNGENALIVSDGVSSSFSATSASEMAIEKIKETLLKDNNTPKESIISAIHEANICIKALPFETREDGVCGPEATVIAAMVVGKTATLGWVGDSRAYVLNKDGQKLLTVDDSWVEMVVADGSMTREEASKDKLAHCVTQVLGMHDQDIEVHTLEHGLESGDMLLLCSDGLWNYFQGENALLKAITAFGMNSDAAHICEHLVGLANSAGGHDNITAALLRIE
jgi:serine/threonine protein phosphatase PrpC